MATRTVTKTKDVCGVWIEFRDERGRTLAQHVVERWRGRYMPREGDGFNITDCRGRRRHRGVVVERRVELQYTPLGEPRLWVQLTVQISPTRVGRTDCLPGFSMN